MFKNVLPYKYTTPTFYYIRWWYGSIIFELLYSCAQQKLIVFRNTYTIEYYSIIVFLEY